MNASKISELEARTDAKSWPELRWLQVHGWYDTITQLNERIANLEAIAQALADELIEDDALLLHLVRAY